MKFVKMQGTGNDFVLVEARGDERDWSRLAAAACDRHFGIGADGLILVLPSQQGDVRMRMFNPDGSESEMCGNGIRCLVRYSVERGLAKRRDGSLTVETIPGVLTAQILDGGRRVRVSMGSPRFEASEIPLAAEVGTRVKDFLLELEGRRLAVTCLSLGNPHAVHFTEKPVDQFPLADLGPKLERHPVFPQRVNFSVARVLGRGRMEARVWERGAGATLACGSGACAVVVAARLHDLVDERVEVRLPGGTLTIEWDADARSGRGEVYLTGPAEFVFEGEWPE